MSNFPIRLRELRKLKNVPQKELSELLKISPRALRFYEDGSREPSINGLITLAKYFDVSIDYLVGLTDNPQRSN